VAARSAGLLLFRTVAGAVEVLLVHPGGPFWAKRDDGAWSIPKGEVSADEDPFRAALREFREEMGEAVDGDFILLQPRRQAGGKTVHAWAVRSEFDPSQLESNTFAMEWPPRSGRWQEFPEIDRAAWFPLDTARVKILKGQVGFLDELRRALDDNEA
jgi:predicted NUDIX family NTP pyrophosphohydrolase